MHVCLEWAVIVRVAHLQNVVGTKVLVELRILTRNL